MELRSLIPIQSVLEKFFISWLRRRLWGESPGTGDKVPRIRGGWFHLQGLKTQVFTDPGVDEQLHDVRQDTSKVVGKRAPLCRAWMVGAELSAAQTKCGFESGDRDAQTGPGVGDLLQGSPGFAD